MFQDKTNQLVSACIKGLSVREIKEISFTSRNKLEYITVRFKNDLVVKARLTVEAIVFLKMINHDQCELKLVKGDVEKKSSFFTEQTMFWMPKKWKSLQFLGLIENDVVHLSGKFGNITIHCLSK